jgi:hypothetical protein
MKTIHKQTKEDLVDATELLLINAALNAAGGREDEAHFALLGRNERVAL